MVQPTNVNANQLKKLIKEAVTEVLANNDTIKMIVAEAVKTAIITVLTEANRTDSNTVTESKQQLVKYQRPAPQINSQGIPKKSNNPMGPGALDFMNVLKNEMMSDNTFAGNDTPTRQQPMKQISNDPADFMADTMNDDLELLKTLGIK